MSTRVTELKLMPYEEYLSTPEWGEKRAQALDRANYRCQICNSPDALQVHHRTYENKGGENPEDLTVLCEKCHTIFHASYLTGKGSKSIRDSLDTYLEHIQNSIEAGELTRSISSGLSDLDNLLGGLRKSDVIVIAGRTGAGKTSLALSMALTAARRFEKRVAIFTLEMSNEQLIQRLVSAEAGIDCRRLQIGQLEEDEWEIFIEAANLLSNTHIFINDTPAISALELRAEVNRMQEEVGLDLIIVDYVQLMRGDLRSSNRQQEISDISHTLKALAKKLNIPIIVISQLPRQVESRPDKRPILPDLAACGSLDEDADVVLFLYREELYNPDTEFPNLAEINVAKNRNGPTGVFSVYFKRNLMQFVDLEIRTQPLDY